MFNVQENAGFIHEFSTKKKKNLPTGFPLPHPCPARSLRSFALPPPPPPPPCWKILATPVNYASE